jgi:hypothetical protein
VFNKTAGYQHPTIPVADALVKKLGQQRGWVVTSVADSSLFTTAGLGQFDVVFWNNNCADSPILTPVERTAFEAFIHAGHGYAGLHGAAWMNYAGWPW